MLTRDDLIDLIVGHLRAAGIGGAPSAPAPPPPAPAAQEKPSDRRVFLSEHDIKKRLTPGGRRLTIPKNAILSPLAADWLVLQGVEIVWE